MSHRARIHRACPSRAAKCIKSGGVRAPNSTNVHSASTFPHCVAIYTGSAAAFKQNPSPWSSVPMLCSLRMSAWSFRVHALSSCLYFWGVRHALIASRGVCKQNTSNSVSVYYVYLNRICNNIDRPQHNEIMLKSSHIHHPFHCEREEKDRRDRWYDIDIIRIGNNSILWDQYVLHIFTYCTVYYEYYSFVNNVYIVKHNSESYRLDLRKILSLLI